MMDAERYRLHRAVRDLLQVLAGADGLVLVLDDLHWADEASVELLGYLLRHPPSGPLLLAVACRPRQASAQLCRILALSSQQGVADVVEVAALDAADADELIPANLAAPQRRKLYESSGGNPFYLQALARGASGSGSVHQAGFDLDSEIPAAVRAVLLAELAALTPRELLAAGAAAVAGGEFDAGLMAEIAELAPGVALAAVDRLAAMDLIRAAGGSGRFQYRHPLVRSVAYQSAGAGWRLAAHARAAAALANRGASAVERAHHVERSAAPGDLAAAGVLAEAAGATMHTAPATAAHLAGAALRLLPHDAASATEAFTTIGVPVENGRCHVLAGIALGALGEADRARDRFAQARTLFEQCGAQLFLDWATREERRMNARMPRRSRQATVDSGTLDHLTRREREVARLAAEGLSNRQIAEKLFLSSRTVELHLSRVFAKLGVSSRAALAALWARQAP